ncbi:Carnitine O-acetyltransferase mitochondrial [Clydaea vesicula]|uniref:Carnitine O-acetyltransferase mitochondrial n=1 Tax=Clydaea vesicula TaxID=447962 RepID=A0AAD5U2U0_9FUNG|nr:Carnitine O-acetyltransferase mitochondrial [Clydaea vesicula]
MLRSFNKFSTIKRNFYATNKNYITFDNQVNLPKLPIPQIADTAHRYLESTKPLLSPQKFEETSKLVQKFTEKGGLGEKLQNRLIDYAATRPNSWLEEIWLNKAYLEWREPSLINVNWWCNFLDSPVHDKLLLKKPPPSGVLSNFQIERAAGLITNLLNFKHLIETETLPPDVAKNVPFCMNQYRYLFHTCRIPQPKCDKLVVNPGATHIIVMLKNQMFKVQVYGKGCSRVSTAEITRQLLAVGKEGLISTEPPIGLLTAAHRDTWTKAYNYLSKSPSHAKNLKLIQDAIFVLCLDDHSTKNNPDHTHLQFFHNFNAENRWFDKSLQFIVASNGKAGVNGEHSPVDAVIPGRLFDYLIQNEPAVDPENVTESLLPPPELLKWRETTEELTDLINEAKTTVKKLINETESVLLHYRVYGGRYIKEIAETSPDSFMQLVLQVAWLRLHKEPTAVYETSSTRAFLHGRTETGRSLSNESLEFAKSFGNDDILYDEQRKLFRNAIQKHLETMKLCAAGKGIDRHLLGLRCMLQGDEAKDSLFSDEAFVKSIPGNRFYGGFGPVVPEGYGVNYAIDKDVIKLSISGKKNTKTKKNAPDVYQFRAMIERTLTDFMILFPKRSSIWGMDWKNLHEEERKEEVYFKSMAKASEDYLKRKTNLEKKYLQ